MWMEQCVGDDYFCILLLRETRVYLFMHNLLIIKWKVKKILIHIFRKKQFDVYPRVNS